VSGDGGRLGGEEDAVYVLVRSSKKIHVDIFEGRDHRCTSLRHEQFLHDHCSVDGPNVNNPPTDPFKQAQAELADVKNIMVHNVESILSRGERIELLVDKTDNLNNQARAFRMRSTQLRRKMWWKNTKLMTLSIFVVLLIVYLLAASACGVSLGHCRS